MEPLARKNRHFVFQARLKTLTDGDATVETAVATCTSAAIAEEITWQENTPALERAGTAETATAVVPTITGRRAEGAKKNAEVSFIVEEALFQDLISFLDANPDVPVSLIPLC